MLTLQDVQRIALALPEAEEYDHGDCPAFRLRGGRRFISMLTDDGLNLMLPEAGIRSAVEEWPEACRANHWGARLASVRVDYRALPDDTVVGLIEEAWAARAPTRLVRER
jgi:hypothetical protein